MRKREVFLYCERKIEGEGEWSFIIFFCSRGANCHGVGDPKMVYYYPPLMPHSPRSLKLWSLHHSFNDGDSSLKKLCPISTDIFLMIIKSKTQKIHARMKKTQWSLKNWWYLHVNVFNDGSECIRREWRRWSHQSMKSCSHTQHKSGKKTSAASLRFHH